jgi:hypothetical protein
MERQVCQLQTVSAKGVTPFCCAQIVPNGTIQEVTERHLYQVTRYSRHSPPFAEFARLHLTHQCRAYVAHSSV